jgi:hypothetical protein
MAFPVIRPKIGLLLIAMQSAEGSPATLDPTLHAVPYEVDSFEYGSPYRSDPADEANGSLVMGAPLIVGQPATIGFRFRLKGAGAGVTYTSTVKPPHHAVFSACGLRGQFSAAALTAGTTTSATLGTGFTGTAQLYRGMPLVLTGSPGAGQIPLITDYTAGKVATLSDLFGTPLSTGTSAAMPANWTYAGTTPYDSASRLTDHPCATVGYYEDGNLLQWNDVRGIVDFEGNTAAPGFGVVRMSGTYAGETAVAVPTNAVVANHSAPILTKGAGTPSAALINRVELPISRWSLRNGGDIENVDDPNTPYGFGPGQITGRAPVFGADPLKTLVSTRDAIAEIGAASNYPIVLRFGQTAGNRLAILAPIAQPTKADPGKRGTMRSLDQEWQLLNPGRDSVTRDGERILAFY